MRIVSQLLAVSACFLLAYSATAQECCEPQDCCKHCGCKKVCKVVCETKKVTKTIWQVQCEEFCPQLPGRGPLGRGPCCDPGCCCEPCGEEAEAACSAEGSCCSDPCASLRCKPVHPPRCGKVRCRRKLVKREVICEVPVYKCVVVCCHGCCDPGCGCGEQEAAPAEPAEAPGPSQAMDAAPLPPVVGTTYLKSLTIGP